MSSPGVAGPGVTRSWAEDGRKDTREKGDKEKIKESRENGKKDEHVVIREKEEDTKIKE